MSNDIKIRKGLTIKLKGEAEKVISDAPRSETFAIKPPDFHTITPKMVVKEGETVKAGQKIAELGKTGSEKPKLHFEIRKNGKPVDPLRFLPRS